MKRFARASIVMFCLAIVFVFGTFLSHSATPLYAAGTAGLPYTGVNLAGGEFGDTMNPGTVNTDYIYPTHTEIDYFVGKGMNTFRVPFLMERLQHTAYGPLTSADLAILDDLVTYATTKGAFILLDPHNYIRYYNKIIGVDIPNAIFANFWGKLGGHFKANAHVIFGLMNEPHDIPTSTLLADENAAIAAIRQAGAKNLILVEGDSWDSGHSWTGNYNGSPNAVTLRNVVDPANNYAFEIHEYLNASTAGDTPDCVSPTIGVERVQAFTAWLHQNNARGFLGEFGGGRNATCYQAIDNLLAHLDANRDVYLGWTYWAAGSRWDPNYIFSLEPLNGQDQPQLAYLRKHVGTAPPSSLALGNSYNQDGLSFDANATNGNLDGDGYSYSATLMPATVTVNGVTFAIGPTSDGANNAVQATGQTVALPRGAYKTVYLLGAAVGGDQTGSFRITYNTGLSKSVAVNMTDWCNVARHGELTALTFAYRNGIWGKQPIANHLFVYALATDGSNTLSSLTFPQNDKMKVLAIAVA